MHGAWLHVDGAFGLFAALLPDAATRPDSVTFALAGGGAAQCGRFLTTHTADGRVLMTHAVPFRRPAVRAAI